MPHPSNDTRELREEEEEEDDEKRAEERESSQQGLRCQTPAARMRQSCQVISCFPRISERFLIRPLSSIGKLG